MLSCVSKHFWHSNLETEQLKERMLLTATMPLLVLVNSQCHQPENIKEVLLASIKYTANSS